MDTLFKSHDKDVSGARILNIIDVSGGFYILFIGLCFASIAFLGEIVVNNLKQYKVCVEPL